MSEMELKGIVDRIVGYKTYSDKRKIDALLEINADIWANQGSDSTKGEKEKAFKDSRVVFRGIKEIDKEMGNSFLRTQDNG